MSDPWLGICALIALFVAIFIGFPIAFTLIALALGVGYYALAIGALLVALVTIAATARVFRRGWEHRIELKLEDVPL